MAFSECVCRAGSRRRRRLSGLCNDSVTISGSFKENGWGEIEKTNAGEKAEI